MLYWLILTFYVYSISNGSVSIHATSVPEPYTTLEACNTAGATAEVAYNGGAKVNHVCVEQAP